MRRPGIASDFSTDAAESQRVNSHCARFGFIRGVKLIFSNWFLIFLYKIEHPNTLVTVATVFALAELNDIGGKLAMDDTMPVRTVWRSAARKLLAQSLQHGRKGFGRIAQIARFEAGRDWSCQSIAQIIGRNRQGRIAVCVVGEQIFDFAIDAEWSQAAGLKFWIFI